MILGLLMLIAQGRAIVILLKGGEPKEPRRVQIAIALIAIAFGLVLMMIAILGLTIE